MRMRLTAIGVVLFLALALMAAPALAQDASRIAHSKNAQKIGLAASVQGTTQSNSGVLLTVQFGYGYFFIDGLELSFNVFAYGNFGSDFDMGGGDFLATLKYYFINKSICVPYIGVQGGGTVIGYTNDSSDPFGTSKSDTEFAFGGSVGGLFGLDFLVNDNLSIYTELNALAVFITSDYYDDVFGLFRFMMGLNFYF